MNCSKCKEEEKTKCGCEVTLSTDCSIYTGEKLECTYIKKSTKLTKILQKLDGFICNIKNGVPASLINIGKQNKIYRTIDAAGKAELRTVETANEDLLKIHQTGDEVEVETGELKLTLSNNTRIQLSTNTDGVDTTLSKINLLDIKADATGAKGKKGKTGASAYDVWIRNGNSGTKQDYIDSLVGAKGLIGAQGSKGKTGVAGPQGDKGDPGKDGTKGVTGDAGPTGGQGDPGDNGTNGTNGKDGKDGTNGKDGPKGPTGDKGDETCDCEPIDDTVFTNVRTTATDGCTNYKFTVVLADKSASSTSMLTTFTIPNDSRGGDLKGEGISLIMSEGARQDVILKDSSTITLINGVGEISITICTYRTEDGYPPALGSITIGTEKYELKHRYV